MINSNESHDYLEIYYSSEQGKDVVTHLDFRNRMTISKKYGIEPKEIKKIKNIFHFDIPDTNTFKRVIKQTTKLPVH